MKKMKLFFVFLILSVLGIYAIESDSQALLDSGAGIIRDEPGMHDCIRNLNFPWEDRSWKNTESFLRECRAWTRGYYWTLEMMEEEETCVDLGDYNAFPEIKIGGLEIEI